MRYITIQLPESFVREWIDALVKVPDLGYSSRAEVVKDAVRTLYQRYIGFQPTPAPTIQNETPPSFEQDKEFQKTRVVLSWIRSKDNISNVYLYPADPLSHQEQDLLQRSAQELTEEGLSGELQEDFSTINYYFEVKMMQSSATNMRLLVTVFLLASQYGEFLGIISDRLHTFADSLKGNTWTYQTINNYENKLKNVNEKKYRAEIEQLLRDIIKDLTL